MNVLNCIQFIASHLELEFDDTPAYGSTIVPPQGFRTDQQAEMTVQLSDLGNFNVLRAAPYENAPLPLASGSVSLSNSQSNRADYGFKFKQHKGNPVLIFRGEHKGRWAQFIASNDTIAQVHLEAGRMTVNIPLDALFDAYAFRILWFKLLFLICLLQNAQ